MNEKKTEHQYFEKYARPDGQMGVRKDEQTGGHVDGHRKNHGEVQGCICTSEAKLATR